ncbi:MAG: DedA family protein [Campylobacteraceae bacterium]
MEEFLIGAIKEYGYIILFVWCLLEGEMALILAGILTHVGKMNFEISIIVATFGAFIGDQIYFYLGRLNQKYVKNKFSKHKRKFALANLLLIKYGYIIIFFQRYLYGLRAILPISIGLSKFDARKFAIINLISAFCWATFFISLSLFFGEEILIAIKYIKSHWYFAIPVIIIVIFLVLYVFKKIEDNLLNKKQLKRV